MALLEFAVAEVNVVTVLGKTLTVRNMLCCEAARELYVIYFGEGIGVHTLMIPSASPVATYDPLALLLHWIMEVLCSVYSSCKRVPRIVHDYLK